MTPRIRTSTSTLLLALASLAYPRRGGTYAPAVVLLFLALMPSARTQPPASVRPVVLLRPAIRFEDLQGGAWVNFGIPEFPVGRSKPVPNDPDQYEHILVAAARSALGSKGASRDAASFDSSLAETYKTLASLGSRLARGSVNEDALQALSQFAAADERYAVLAQFLRVQVGPGRAWNPNTGAIASSSASTLFQSALLDAKTGKVLWKSEQLVRHKALRPSDAAFGKALKDLYNGFDIPQGESK